MRSGSHFLFLIPCLILFSCSSEKSSDITKQRTSDESGVHSSAQENHAATAGPYSLNLAPGDPTRSSTLYLSPKGFSLSDAKVEWLVNGNTADSSFPQHFKAAGTRKGDNVQAKASIEGKEIYSNSVKIKNALPDIQNPGIFPDVVNSINTVRAEATGSDVDSDEITFIYEWTKNGEPAGSGKHIGVPIRRGDKVSVKITPFDGEAYGYYVLTHATVTNLPPNIIEDKSFKYTFDGKGYTYQVKASDPDGDALTYSLKSSPQGMTINPSTGLVQWNVPADFKGKAPFTVSVNDGHGGEVSQSLAVEIK